MLAVPGVLRLTLFAQDKQDEAWVPLYQIYWASNIFALRGKRKNDLD